MNHDERFNFVGLIYDTGHIGWGGESAEQRPRFVTISAVRINN